MTAEDTQAAEKMTLTDVRESLAEHFVMWHDVDGRIGGDWRCACGLKFGFSDTAIDHQAAIVERIVAARVAEAVERERERIARCLRTEAHSRNDASFNRVLRFAAGCVLAKYDKNDAHSFCLNPSTCPRCSLLDREAAPINTSGPDRGFASMCGRCGRGLVSVGEWCCGGFTS